jgi:phosphatidylserine/phosphatidylglycerophosphate/cardiolipin synthase-like enzyme
MQRHPRDRSLVDNTKSNQLHGIKDNHSRGNVASFLDARATAGSNLSVVSAYFTIYAYHALKEKLNGINSLKFLFGEPRFISSLDPEKTDKKAFKIEDDGIALSNRLEQRKVASSCAAWLKEKVDIRSIRHANLLHGKLYHIDDGRREHAILGSSNFTRRGLGIVDYHLDLTQ